MKEITIKINSFPKQRRYNRAPGLMYFSCPLCGKIFLRPAIMVDIEIEGSFDYLDYLNIYAYECKACDVKYILEFLTSHQNDMSQKIATKVDDLQYLVSRLSEIRAEYFSSSGFRAIPDWILSEKSDYCDQLDTSPRDKP